MRVHIAQQTCTLNLDSSLKLHTIKRGYSKAPQPLSSALQTQTLNPNNPSTPQPQPQPQPHQPPAGHQLPRAAAHDERGAGASAPHNAGWVRGWGLVGWGVGAEGVCEL